MSIRNEFLILLLKQMVEIENVDIENVDENSKSRQRPVISDNELCMIAFLFFFITTITVSKNLFH